MLNIESSNTTKVKSAVTYAAYRYDDKKSIALNFEAIDDFINELRTKGRVKGTLEWYQRGLVNLYYSLPEDKQIRRGTLVKWQEDLRKNGYAPRTMNLFFAAVNGFLKRAGARDLQISNRLEPSDEPQPELSRTEYLRLLQTAKLLGKEREYLLIKLFGTTGLPLQELSQVTVESVHNGKLLTTSSKNKQIICLPDFLCKELLSYASRNAIEIGAVFLTRDRKPMGRTNVTMAIRQICVAAQLPEEKGNPRCLKRLYHATITGIEDNVALLVEHAHKRIIEKEQLSVGWDQ